VCPAQKIRVSTEATRSRIQDFISNLAVKKKSAVPEFKAGRVPDIVC